MGAPGRAWRLARRPAAGIAALLLLAAANASLLRQTGCDPNSQFGIVRAIAIEGQLSIDRYQWQTCDKSYFRGHFYSNKAPGLAFVAVPVYAALRLVGLEGEHLPSQASYKASGDDLRTATWPLTVIGAVLPALLAMLLVRRLGEELAPGHGTAAAMTLGAATLLLPFSSAFFQHALSAALGFAAFAVLWIERRGPPRLLHVAAGGALAAYAASVEYPLALVAAVLGLYAVWRADWPRRGLSYVAGAAVGIAPLLVYNQLAFGSVRHLSYADQVRNQGQTGHDTIGAQSRGLYGVTQPRLSHGLALLLGHKGLLVLGPVIALGLVGIVLLYRRGYRAEALVCLAVPAGFVGYDSGFTIGGDVPGPRYLIPALPFLAVPLALVWRRVPLTTLLLAAGSAVCMVVATVTGGSWGGNGVWPWFTALGHSHAQHTLLTLAGAGQGWIALAPFVLLLAGSVVCAVRATPHRAVQRRDAELTVAALSGWLLLGGVGPLLLEGPGHAVDLATLLLVAAVAAVAWAVWSRGLWALAAGAPLLALLEPSLSDRPAWVSGAALLSLSIVAAFLLRRPQRTPPTVGEPRDAEGETVVVG